MVGHEAGAGRHKGRLGALLVELADGTKFSVGTGFSDAERNCPPAIGCTITFRYQELTDRGVPRFPSYVGLRNDLPVAADAPPCVKPAKPARATVSSGVKRRFQFVEGSSDKFWEIETNGSEVTVRYGRTGSNGQTNVKTFPTAAAAQSHADKLIEEKVDKGYIEM